MAIRNVSLFLRLCAKQKCRLIGRLSVYVAFSSCVLFVILLFYSRDYFLPAKRSLFSRNTEQIHVSVTTYNETRTVQEALLSVVAAQLSPYFGVPSLGVDTYFLPREGHFRITQDTLNAMEFIGANLNLGVRIRIVDGGKRLVYRRLTQLLYGYLNQRLATIMQMIEEMMSEGYFQEWTSSDGVDFIIILHGPASSIHSHGVAHGLPMFTFISSTFHSDLILPDPSNFGSNGNYVWPNIAELVPWSQKKNRLVFRGKGDCYNFHSNNWFSCTRVRAARLSKFYPEDLDIALTQFNHLDGDTPPFVYHEQSLRHKGIGNPPTTDQLESQTNLTLASFMSFKEQSGYKYILDIDGSMGSSRKSQIIGSGSILFSQESPWKRWFEPLLFPNVHYVPVDVNLKDLRNKVLWAKQNDEYMQRMARLGRAFKDRYLTTPAAKLYIKLLLDGYKQLLVDRVTTADVTTDYCALHGYETLKQKIMRGPLGCSSGWMIWPKNTLLKRESK